MAVLLMMTVVMISATLTKEETYTLKKKVNKSESKEATESGSVKKDGVEDLNLLLGYDGVEIKRLKIESEKTETKPEVGSSENQDIIPPPAKTILNPYEEQRERYYERLVQDEIEARKANIGIQDSEKHT